MWSWAREPGGTRKMKGGGNMQEKNDSIVGARAIRVTAGLIRPTRRDRGKKKGKEKVKKK